MRLSIALVCLCSSVCAAACASAPAPPVTDDGAAGLAETSEPREPAGGHEAPPPKASSAPADTAAVPADREISAHECQVLAQRYGDLTRSDNMNALPQGLTAGQRQQAQSNIMSASDKLSARWEQGCIESLVGKVASEDALKCAMAAKTVADFDVCLNGPAAKP